MSQQERQSRRFDIACFVVRHLKTDRFYFDSSEAFRGVNTTISDFTSDIRIARQFRTKQEAVSAVGNIIDECEVLRTYTRIVLSNPVDVSKEAEEQKSKWAAVNALTQMEIEAKQKIDEAMRVDMKNPEVTQLRAHLQNISIQKSRLMRQR